MAGKSVPPPLSPQTPQSIKEDSLLLCQQAPLHSEASTNENENGFLQRRWTNNMRSSRSDLSQRRSSRRNLMGGSNAFYENDTLSSALVETSVLAPPTAMGETTQSVPSIDLNNNSPPELSSADHMQYSRQSNASSSNGTLFNEVMMRSVQKPSRLSAGSYSNSNSNSNSSNTGTKLPTTPVSSDKTSGGNAMSKKRQRTPSTDSRNNSESKQLLLARTPSAMTEGDTIGALSQSQQIRTPTTAATLLSFSTPADKGGKATDIAAKAMFTPQGFQMLQCINQAEDSPFQPRQPETMTSENVQNAESQQVQPPPPPVKPRLEWYHLEPRSQTNQPDLILPWLDWSLKDQVTFEMKGMDSEKQLLSKLLNINAVIQQQALQAFCCGGPGHNTPILEQWASSLLYWQYPPNEAKVSGNKNPLRGSSTSQILRRSASLTGSLSFGKDDASRFSRSASRILPPVHVQSRKVAEQLSKWKDSTNTISSSNKSGAREWQDAFWSLYGNWRMAVHERMEENKAGKCSLEDVTRTCFYAFGLGHSVLFRLNFQFAKNEAPEKVEQASPWNDGGSSESEDEDEIRPIGDLVPEIIFSSSNSETRDKLRQMGARLRFTHGPVGLDLNFDDEEAFWNGVEEKKASTLTNKTSAAQSSPSIQADLIALRREQAMGQVVGADITVDVHKKRKVSSRRPSLKGLPPLMVSGSDDCASFAQLYLNACGSFLDLEGTDSQQRQHLFPVLLCRQKVGPFCHSSIKKVHVQRMMRSGACALVAKGFILPCALRDMVRACRDASQDHSNNETGQLEAHCRLFKGNETSPAEDYIGGPSTVFFNCGSKLHKEHAEEEKSRSIFYCDPGEVVLEIVHSQADAFECSVKVERQLGSLS